VVLIGARCFHKAIEANAAVRGYEPPTDCRTFRTLPHVATGAASQPLSKLRTRVLCGGLKRKIAPSLIAKTDYRLRRSGRAREINELHAR